MKSNEHAGMPANSALARASGAIVRSFEVLSLRGAPTILKLLWNVRPLRKQMATTKLGTGEIITFPAFDSYWCRYIWAGAQYEEEVEQIFRKIGRRRVLVDCGANIGYWTVRAPEFGFSQVIAIEANRDLVPILRENFRLNQISGAVHHAAVYSRSGEHLFLDHTDQHAVAGIGESGMPVISMTIADAVKHLPADQEVVVKLDVEGAEIPAFEGAEGLKKAIFVYEDFVRLDMAVTRYLLDRGMAVFGVSISGEHARISTPEEGAAFTPPNVSILRPTNLVACHPEQADKLAAELLQ